MALVPGDKPAGDKPAGEMLKRRIGESYPELTARMKQTNVSYGSGSRRDLQFFPANHPQNPTPGSEHVVIPAGGDVERLHHEVATKMMAAGGAPVTKAGGAEQGQNAPQGKQAAEPVVVRVRSRSSAMTVDRMTIANRVIDFYAADIQARTFDIEARLQRHAKFRMWTEGKDVPWPGSSDIGYPDMATASHRTQDTLHNAVMSTRPVVTSKAVKKTDTDKQAVVDHLLDYQFFEENRGEVTVGKMAENFVNDGIVRVFVPWVREDRATHEIRQLPAIPDDAPPNEYFALALMQAYPQTQLREMDPSGWTWRVMEADEGFVVNFYTNRDGTVEMDAERVAEVLNGPCPIVKDYEEITKPARAANLQIPGPSNPRGSAHVCLVDYPTVDEIKRLVESGYYDMVTGEDRMKFGLAEQDSENQLLQEQRDTMAGVAYRGEPTTIGQPAAGTDASRIENDHKTLTRIMCFDIYDADGDGKNEDVIWWVIKETKTLLRARELTQQFPSTPPRRPFAEAEFLPGGVSLLELMEGLHDAQKMLLDQTVDTGTLTTIPWGVYRQTSSMRPETIRYSPGELYGTADPKNDVHFPQMPQAGSTFGFNMLQMLGAMEERLTSIGDLQTGRVPQGKASALRTVRGMQTIMAQGDARPERVLRRFFMCLTEVFAQMHELNQVFLPRNKQFRITGVPRPGEDPYRAVKDPAEIRGRFQFGFHANAMNTSKDAMREALGSLAATYLTPLAIQLGVVTSEGAYQLYRDLGKSVGQDPDKYLTPPSPDDRLPKMLAEEVLTTIMSGNLPEARPMEPPEEHMAKLMDFAKTDAIGLLTPPQIDMLKAYLKLTVQRIAAEQQRQALVAAAGMPGQQTGGDGVPGPKPGVPEPRTSGAPVQPGEHADETMMGAGGGAQQQGMMQ